MFVCVCVFVQIRQRVLTEATFNKAELTKLIGGRWVGFDDPDWNLRTFGDKRDDERCVCDGERESFINSKGLH